MLLRSDSWSLLISIPCKRRRTRDKTGEGMCEAREKHINTGGVQSMHTSKGEREGGLRDLYTHTRIHIHLNGEGEKHTQHMPAKK